MMNYLITDDSEQKRLEDPQAQLIPQALWYTHFKQTLSAPQRQYFSHAIDEIALPETLSTTDWLCILIAHPSAEKELFILVQKNPEIMTKLSVACVLLARKELLTRLFAKFPPELSTIHASLIVAIKQEDNDLIHFLYSQNGDEKQALIAYDKYSLFLNASLYAEALFVTKLVEDCHIEKRNRMIATLSLRKQLYHLVNQAYKKDRDLEIVRAIINHIPAKKFNRLLEKLLYLAIIKGEKGIFEQCIHLNPNACKQYLKSNTSYVIAAQNAQSDMMDKIEQLVAVCREDEFRAFICAAAHGHIAIIDKLVAKNPDDLNEMLQSDAEYLVGFQKPFNAFYHASLNGHVQMTCYLVKLSGGDSKMIMSNSGSTFRIRENSANCIKQVMYFLSILTLKKEQGNFQKALTITVQNAISTELTDVLDELKKIYPEQINDLLTHFFKAHCKNLPPQSIAWYFANFPEFCKNVLQEDNYSKIFNATSSLNYQSSETTYAFLQQLQENSQALLSSDNYSIIYRAARENKFHYVTEYLKKLPAEEVDKVLQEKKFALFIDAIIHKKFNVIEPFITPSFVSNFISKVAPLPVNAGSEQAEIIETPDAPLPETPQELKQRLFDCALIGFVIQGQTALIALLFEECSFTPAMIHKAMIQALEYKHESAFDYLYSREENNKQSLIEYDNFSLFTKACFCKNMRVIRKLGRECASDKRAAMTHASHNELHAQFVRNGAEDKDSPYLWVLHKVIDQSNLQKLKEPEVLASLLKLAIIKNDGTTFIKCCQTSADAVCEWLEKNSGYAIAAGYGHIEIMEKIEGLIPIDEQEEQKAFVTAAEKGQFNAISFLVPAHIPQYNPDYVDKILKSEVCRAAHSPKPYNAFYQARDKCHYQVIDYLLMLSRQDLNMIIANDYAAFCVHSNSFFKDQKPSSVKQTSSVSSGKSKEDNEAEFSQELLENEAALVKNLLSILIEKNEQAHFQKALATTIYTALIAKREDILEMLKETYPEIMAPFAAGFLTEEDSYIAIKNNCSFLLTLHPDLKIVEQPENTSNPLEQSKNSLVHDNSSSLNSKTCSDYFYLECLNALMVLGGVGAVIAGIILPNPVLIGVGAGLATLGLASNLTRYSLFAPLRKSNIENDASPALIELAVGK